MPILVTCPFHGDTLTPAAARSRALTYMTLADEAEGLTIAQRPVEAWEIVAELAQLREQVGRLERAMVPRL